MNKMNAANSGYTPLKRRIAANVAPQCRATRGIAAQQEICEIRPHLVASLLCGHTSPLAASVERELT